MHIARACRADDDGGKDHRHDQHADETEKKRADWRNGVRRVAEDHARNQPGNQGQHDFFPERPGPEKAQADQRNAQQRDEFRHVAAFGPYVRIRAKHDGQRGD